MPFVGFTAVNVAQDNSLSQHVGETPARAREPPVAKEKADQRKGREVDESEPVRLRAFEEDAAIIAYKRRERIEIDEGSIARGH